MVALVALVGSTVLAGQVLAQDSAQPSSGSVDSASMSLPPTFRLDGLEMVWQQLNRCSAGALTIQLSYFDWDGDYAKTIQGLNPHIEDVSVRLDEMVRFVEEQGLRGIERTGGTIDLLNMLVANGFPVLVENSYYDGDDLNRDWMSHNRIITGYDDALGVLYSFDSLLGAGEDGRGRPVPYDDFLTRWQPFNYDYFIIYKPGDEPLLQALMGDQWDAAYNAEWTLALAEADLENAPNSFAMFNKGSALAALGRYEEAAEAFDAARATGLPWRMLWYQFGPFESYLAVGRYDDVIELARSVISATPGVEETYYYIALAYEAQGDLERAEANLEVAAMRNLNFSAAAEALAELRQRLGETAS